jgi:hypothetical protein
MVVLALVMFCGYGASVAAVPASTGEFINARWLAEENSCSGINHTLFIQCYTIAARKLNNKIIKQAIVKSRKADAEKIFFYTYNMFNLLNKP